MTSSDATVHAPRNLLLFEGAPVAIESRFGAPASKDVRLSGQLARDARPAMVRTEGTVVAASVLPAEGGRPAGVRLSLSGKQAGQGVGNVVVSTGLADPKELVLYYGWKVPGNLTVTPSNPYLDLRAPGSPVVEISVASRRSDFRLERAEVVSGPFAARVAPARGGSYVVQVRAVASAASGDRRGFLGTLVLVSNDPAEPHKEIPLFALGALNPPAEKIP